MQLLPDFSLMPDVQLLLDPASDLDEDQVRVFGVRGLLGIRPPPPPGAASCGDRGE